MSTDPSGVDPCPRCGGTSGVKVITGTNPRLQLFLDRLTATVVLRQVIALAEQAPGLSDDQLWARRAGLARGSPGRRRDCDCLPWHQRDPRSAAG